MKLRDALLVPMLLTAGVAIPLYVGAQSANDEPVVITMADDALSEQVELLLTQLGSDTPALRESAEKQLLAKGAAAVPHLKRALEQAAKDGDADSQARLRVLIERVSAQNADQPAKERSGLFKSGDGNRHVWRIEPGTGAAKTMVWAENGKTTSVSQDADGKITLKLNEGGTETTESFDTLEAFKEKHPDLAKRFSDSTAFGSTFRVFKDVDDNEANDPLDAVRRSLFREVPHLELFGRAGAVNVEALRQQLKELETHLNRAASQNDELAKLIPEGATAEDITKNLDAIRKTIEDNKRNLESAKSAATEAGKSAGARSESVERAVERAKAMREQAEQELRAAQERARKAQEEFRRALEGRPAPAEPKEGDAEKQAQPRAESPIERMQREMDQWQREMQERLNRQMEEWRKRSAQPRNETPRTPEPEKKPEPDKTESDW